MRCPRSYQASNPCKPVINTWYWNGCNHASHIDDAGRILCKTCSGKKYFVKDVGFKCQDVNHVEYEKFTATAFADALSMASSALTNEFNMNEAEKRIFLQNVLLVTMQSYM